MTSSNYRRNWSIYFIVKMLSYNQDPFVSKKQGDWLLGGNNVVSKRGHLALEGSSLIDLCAYPKLLLCRCSFNYLKGTPKVGMMAHTQLQHSGH